MPISILQTKLYIPPPRPNLVDRSRLLNRLNAGVPGKLTLISAPAGFGKSTLISAWVADRTQPVGWLSLDEGDSDPNQFLAYFVAALQTIAPEIGKGVLALINAPQPPPIASVLTTLLNEISALSEPFILVLDDYHVVGAKPIDDALTFLLEQMPPQMHLVITTREDPPLPLARLRARAQLVEVRAAELRFTPTEAADFLNQVMGLALSTEEVEALETRTEGWIAGLQLAAVSMQGFQSMGNQNITQFIQSFTGSHRFVMDYLLEEVLHQQPQSLQTFLLNTAILDRMCGPLCDALLRTPTATGQATLEALEQANLFIVPLDNERRWYRYHHLFAELLRQRLQQILSEARHSTDGHSEEGHSEEGRSNTNESAPSVEELHRRASHWYEEHGLELEAFHHATLANDIELAERLIEGKGMPLHFRGAIRPVLTWLDTLPTTVLDNHPSLWLAHASTLLATGQVDRTNTALLAAERVLHSRENTVGLDANDRDLIGRIAAIRATVAAGLQQRDAIIAQSEQALHYLHSDNLAFRTSTNWKLGYAYHLSGDFAAAKQAYQEAIAKSQASGNTIFAIMSFIGLADILLIDNQLSLAAENYHNAVQLYGEQPLPSASEAYSGLAQIYYEWNDLDAAEQYAQQGCQLGWQWAKSDTPIRSEWMLARIQFARGDVAGAAAQLTRTIRFMQQSNFTRHSDDLLATQICLLLAQGNLAEAATFAESRELPLSQARVQLAQGATDLALSLLETTRQTMITNGRADKVLRLMTLQAVALNSAGRTEDALRVLGETLAQAQHGGYIRLFVDEGKPMAQLLTHLLPQQLSGSMFYEVDAGYLKQLLAAFSTDALADTDRSGQSTTADHQPLVEPLSEREIEVLAMIADGYKNQEIADKLIISLNTVRYHTKNIYGKLSVNKRTQAVAKAQRLNLL